ncbi:MAG: L-glutamate gamma-semialdehyde dehydrogenase [Actinomycetota bacterium]|nr:L-glutamate gamma-semialdehyde dehydrogenase [Actinomycetota bacterium]
MSATTRRSRVFEPYRNESYSDFSDPANRSAYQAALQAVGAQAGRYFPLVIGGEPVQSHQRIESRNPCRPREVVGTSGSADSQLAGQALEAAWRAFPSWSGLTPEERARHLMKLAEVMRRRKYELAAWETLEAGKNWPEAEADVAEAIDFCDYYARQALELGRPLPVYPYPGEDNVSFLVPLGAGVVIPPWNFPLAILAGMTAGPVAAGNTVVVKPASNTPIIAAQFMQAVEEAGLPPGVINYLPGPGGEVGDFLVDHPRTRFINFTGSKEVGLRIAERSAVVHTGQQWLKRAYMEMGGKDAIVVDETADLEAAAEGIVRSAFGFQGQKCSAASRAILVDQVHDEVLERVVELARTLEVGPAEENLPVNAVISDTQYEAILSEIDKGRDQAELVLGGDQLDRDGGYYIQPTIFSGVAPEDRLAQYEIFGPVLSVIRAGDFDQGVQIFNDTEYGLTGGLYSRDRSRLDRARRDFHVGNLYLNRKITGALVGVQPFGGFKMSGSNAKAGGPDYLRLFMEMKTVAERW